MRQHICDRSGRPEKIVDRTGERPLVRLYPTCSLCGMPQIIEKGRRLIDRSAEGEVAE